MARESAAVRNARILRETHEATFGSLTVDGLKDAIVAGVKAREDFKESKKAETKSWNELIKEKEQSIQYCSERIDHLNHESAVANQLEQAR